MSPNEDAGIRLATDAKCHPTGTRGMGSKTVCVVVERGDYRCGKLLYIMNVLAENDAVLEIRVKTSPVQRTVLKKTKRFKRNIQIRVKLTFKQPHSTLENQVLVCVRLLRTS